MFSSFYVIEKIRKRKCNFVKKMNNYKTFGTKEKLKIKRGVKF